MSDIGMIHYFQSRVTNLSSDYLWNYKRNLTIGMCISSATKSTLELFLTKKETYSKKVNNSYNDYI